MTLAIVTNEQVFGGLKQSKGPVFEALLVEKFASNTSGPGFESRHRQFLFTVLERRKEAGKANSKTGFFTEK